MEKQNYVKNIDIYTIAYCDLARFTNHMPIYLDYNSRKCIDLKNMYIIKENTLLNVYS